MFKKNVDYPFVLFDKLPIPEMYLKKNESKLKKGEHDSFLFGSFNFKFNILLNKDQALSEFLNEFKYEQIIKSEEQISKWLSEFKTLFRNAIKSLYFDFDSNISF